MWSLFHALHGAPQGVALVALGALVAACFWAALSRSVASLAALVVLLGLWLLTDASMEGGILLSVRPSHGFTLGDLLGIACAAMALLVRTTQRRPRRRPRHR